MTKKVPSVFICMPTYDTMHVATCLSLIKLFDKFTQAKIKVDQNVCESKSRQSKRNRNEPRQILKQIRKYETNCRTEIIK